MNRMRREQKLLASEYGYRTLIEQVENVARVSACVAHVLLSGARSGSAPSVVFSVVARVN
jgi:hypothetical protein